MITQNDIDRLTEKIKSINDSFGEIERLNKKTMVLCIVSCALNLINLAIHIYRAIV